jgi:hypothetical protein
MQRNETWLLPPEWAYHAFAAAVVAWTMWVAVVAFFSALRI